MYDIDEMLWQFFNPQCSSVGIAVRCVCGGRMVYTDTTLQGDIYKCISRLPDGEWCGRFLVVGGLYR